MSDGLLEKARKALLKRKAERDEKKREIEERMKGILGQGETKDDDSKRPQGKDVRK